MKIGHGDDVYTSSKMNFHMKMNEIGWYHIPSDVSDITNVASSVYHGKPVTRHEFLSILVDVKHILLRSTFHTDQIEALLEQASMEFEQADDGYGSVEKCSCPSGKKRVINKWPTFI